MSILTPGGNKRLNELIGFLWLVAAALVGLSLLSYSPLDPSLNTAAPVRLAEPSAAATANWVGVAGAYLADLLLQALGYVAYLIPLAFLALAWFWLRSRPFAAPGTKLAGALLLLFSLTSLLGLVEVLPRVHGLLPAGGLLGVLLALGLTQVLNFPGALVVTLALLVAGIFLTTPFSFSGSVTWVQGHTGLVRTALAAIASMAGRLRGWVSRWQPWKRAAEYPAPKPRIVPSAKGISAPLEIPEPLSRRPALRPSDVSAIPITEPEDDWENPTGEAGGREGFAARRARVVRARYRLPSAALLKLPEHLSGPGEKELQQRAHAVTEKLREFAVTGQVTQINPGPVVTTFEFRPEAGVKLSRITSLAEDLCLAVKAESILIDRIPGKSTVGIEVPNPKREIIVLRDIIESQEFAASSSKLTIPLGRDLTGRTRVADLAQMPHLLIAGSTGSGKSVAINSMIISMLYKSNPDEVKFILIDPKRLELGLYEGIPHLFTPIVTDTKLAANALRNATREMERRLKVLAKYGVRNLLQFNQLFEDEETLPGLNEDGEEVEPLPYIVIIIDELADLMMVDTPNVEQSVTRLAQMARAVGIHLILATQRPSVDVITGLIKANFPARISFRVATKVDSRTILDANGAEALLGMGDMLYLPAGSSRLHRVHGPLVTESEIVHVCDFWRSHGQPDYHEDFLKFPKDVERPRGSRAAGEDDSVDADDELYEEAVRIVCELGKASTSTLQRRLRIGYGRAARLLDIMEQEGIIGPPDGSRPREVLKKKDFLRV